MARCKANDNAQPCGPVRVGSRPGIDLAVVRSPRCHRGGPVINRGDGREGPLGRDCHSARPFARLPRCGCVLLRRCHRGVCARASREPPAWAGPQAHGAQGATPGDPRRPPQIPWVWSGPRSLFLCRGLAIALSGQRGTAPGGRPKAGQPVNGGARGIPHRVGDSIASGERKKTSCWVKPRRSRASKVESVKASRPMTQCACLARTERSIHASLA